ncbi:MAG: glycosyltransferase family 39 protein [Chloroflexi bacterium]|nr:glycosyltransferase family 39 protein [Chloroflexota bacterium]
MMIMRFRSWSKHWGQLAVKISRRRLQFVFLISCLVFLWIFGITSLKAMPIANDEYSTVIHVYDIWRDYPFNIPDTLENVSTVIPDHGPLYFVMMNIWLRIAGADVFVARLPSVFFAMLALATTYRLARIGGQAEAGLTAVALLAFLSFFLYYTHIARMYTLLPLAAGLVVWSYWRASRGGAPTRLWIWLLLLVSSAAITYIHYSGAILLSAIGLYHLLFAHKNRRWWQISALVTGAALLFVPWLPVVLDGVAHSRAAMSTTRLSLLEALGAGFTIYANGIVILPVMVLALILRFRRRFNRAEKYILLIVFFAFALLLLLNEFTPLLVESRLRYLIFLAVPAAGALALGWQFVPGGGRIRIALFCIWALASFAFARSDYFNVVTNRQLLREDKLVHYQAFKYDLRDLPGYDQLIVSFHPGAPVVWKTAEYYRAVLDKWKYIVHITYDQEGELLVQSGIPPRFTLDDIDADSDGLWVIHNPRQTDLHALDVYQHWFLERFKPCKRFVETADNVIKFYLRRSLPCGLAFAENPLAIEYDNGLRLANLIVEEAPSQLSVYFWWAEILQSEYSFSLQVFDQDSNRVLGSDGLIWRAPAHERSLDVSALRAGEYTLQLIVYDYETGESQPGLILEEQRRFERRVEIARFTVEA